MENENELTVWYEQKVVGQLWRDNTNAIGFIYEQNWLTNGFSISQQLPLEEEKFLPESGKAHQFFANLLPEAGAREHIIRDLKIPNTDFELLRALGGECAGALSILPVGEQPILNKKYRQLTADDLKILLLRKGQISTFSNDKEHPRLSLAGAQDKCPIFVDNNQYYLPEDSAPSTHILKFEIAGYRNIPLYEYYLAQLAHAVGLPVVEIELRQQDKHYYLLIKRYDRILTSANKIKRIHQEDFCQALGYGYAHKYQIHGGPTFKDCYQLTKAISKNPIKDLDNLLRWQMFNVLAGNSDGHAKNLALIYDENMNVQLAPFYDLVCTRAIERIDTKLGLAIADEYNPDKISIKHWEQMALDCKLQPGNLLNTLKKMAEWLLEQLPKVSQNVECSVGIFPALQRVELVVKKQCNKTLQMLL